MRLGLNTRRSRGRGGPPRRRQMHRPNQQLDSNGPAGRVRGTATHIYERYLMQARDAQTVGDTVRAEPLLQPAAHYFTLLNLKVQGREQVNHTHPRQVATRKERRRGKAW